MMQLTGAPSLLLMLTSVAFVTIQSQVPPEKPECTGSWQSTQLTFVPTLAYCSEYEGGVPCSPNSPSICTGRNPFCAFVEGSTQHVCCGDIVQDSERQTELQSTEIKPICPNGAISFKIPHILLCDPTIVNICPYDYTCVQAANGNLLPEENRNLCCKTSTLYSFAAVFFEAGITPHIVPTAPIAAIDFVTLNIHTSTTATYPEIRSGDHFVIVPYKLLEPAYLRKVTLIQEQQSGSYLHVLLFDPQGTTENLQFYYDRPSTPGKEIDLTLPISDGGFINKVTIMGAASTTLDQLPINTYRKRYVVIVFKTIQPLTRHYISVTTDLNSGYKSVSEFLRSDTGRRLGTPIAGSYFYLTTE